MQFVELHSPLESLQVVLQQSCSLLTPDFAVFIIFRLRQIRTLHSCRIIRKVVDIGSGILATRKTFAKFALSLFVGDISKFPFDSFLNLGTFNDSLQNALNVSFSPS